MTRRRNKRTSNSNPMKKLFTLPTRVLDYTVGTVLVLAHLVRATRLAAAHDSLR